MFNMISPIYCQPCRYRRWSIWVWHWKFSKSWSNVSRIIRT